MWQFLYMLLCLSESPEKFSSLSFPAMAAEENKGDGSLTGQRQRFYVELKHGETTIVSWKKLLKEARKKDQCPLPSSGPYSSSSTVPETQEISCDAGQCNNSVIKSKRVKHVATSSDHIQHSKHRGKMTKIEGEKNDGDSSQLARPNGINGKVTSETKNLFKHSSSPAKDINGDAGRCNDSVTKNKRVKHVATSSDHIQQSKHKGKMTKVEGEKNDGDSSVQLARPIGMNGKVTSETKNLFKHSSSPAKVKDNPPKEVRASTVDVPLLTYSKRRRVFHSKSKCPPLNAVEDACVFPLKATHNVVQKTRNSSTEGSNMKVGVGGHSYAAMHQKKEECSPVKADSTSGMLHDEVSSKRCHNDKSGGSRAHIDAIPPRYKSPLKDSKAEKFKEVTSESFAMGHNLADTVKTKHVQPPCKKRKATESRNDHNSIPYLPKKMASKKAAIELPALKRESSDSIAKDVKLTFKQKPSVPQKSNVKVRFLLKQEHETLRSNEKDARQPAYP